MFCNSTVVWVKLTILVNGDEISWGIKFSRPAEMVFLIYYFDEKPTRLRTKINLHRKYYAELILVETWMLVDEWMETYLTTEGPDWRKLECHLMISWRTGSLLNSHKDCQLNFNLELCRLVGEDTNVKVDFPAPTFIKAQHYRAEGLNGTCKMTVRYGRWRLIDQIRSGIFPTKISWKIVSVHWRPLQPLSSSLALFNFASGIYRSRSSMALSIRLIGHSQLRTRTSTARTDTVRQDRAGRNLCEPGNLFHFRKARKSNEFGLDECKWDSQMVTLFKDSIGSRLDLPACHNLAMMRRLFLAISRATTVERFPIKVSGRLVILSQICPRFYVTQSMRWRSIKIKLPPKLLYAEWST